MNQEKKKQKTLEATFQLPKKVVGRTLGYFKIKVYILPRSQALEITSKC